MGKPEEVEERVSELETKVAYLEKELDISYDRQKFEREMNRLIPTGCGEIEISDNRIGGYHARFSELTIDQLNAAIENIEFRDTDYEWSVTETSEGVGLEVWSNEY